MNKWNDFKRGFRLNHAAVLAASLLLLIISLSTLEIFLRSPLFITIPEELLLTAPTDQITHMSLEARRLKAHESALYFFGGSALREALSHPAHIFGSRNQSFAEATVLIDQLPSKGALILGVNPWHFSYEPKTLLKEFRDYWFLSPSDHLTSLMREEEAPHFWDHLLLSGMRGYLAYYWKYNATQLMKGEWPSHQYTPHLYDNAPKLTSSQFENALAQMEKVRASGFSTHTEFQRESLKRLVLLARNKNLTIAFVETPFHPIAQERFKKVLEVYTPMIQKLAQELNVPYSNAGRTAAWKDEDFYDAIHLRPEGRSKFESKFSQQLGTTVL